MCADSKGAMESLDRCQKRILCRFIGVDPIARNVVIQGVTNLPPFEVRVKILLSKRTRRLQEILDSLAWMDHALAYTLRCILSEPLPDISLMEASKPRIMQTFKSDIETKLSGIFDGCLERVTLRWLMNVTASPGIKRTILLWILGRWSCFSPRRCRRCNSAFLQQAHVIDCTNLPERLASSELMIKLTNFVEINPQFIVEQYLEAIRTSDPGESEKQLTCLEQFIRESVH